MKSIKENITNEIVINKSKFITILLKINNVDEVKENINNIKNKYKNATHYCFGYIIHNHEKCSDDGEPSGTAGMPILNILKKNNLTNVLCVVVRYFGGIKLGAGGLIRAYSNSVTKALNKSKIVDLIEGFHLEIEFNYGNIKKIDYLLKDLNIKKEFNDTIKYTFDISKEELEKLNLDNLCVIKAKEKIIL